jgi:hypothetical protein
VAIGGQSDLKLGSNAIRRGDEDGIPEARGSNIEQAAETADFDIGARPGGRSYVRFQRIDQRRACFDVDACILVITCVNGFLAGLRS